MSTVHHGPAAYPRTSVWVGVVVMVAVLTNLTALSAIVGVAILLAVGVLILLTKGAHR